MVEVVQVSSDEAVVLEQVGGGAVVDGSSLVEQEEVIADALEIRCDVAGVEGGVVGVFHVLGDEVEEVIASERVQAGGGFIEDE